MPQSPFKTAKFKKLQSSWYKKLKTKGFEDQEKGEIGLKQYSGVQSTDVSYESTSGIGDHEKYVYYSQARAFLTNHKFKNKKERKIFELHSEGLGVRVIAVVLKSYRRKVHETLQRLIKEMNGKT